MKTEAIEPGNRKAGPEYRKVISVTHRPVTLAVLGCHCEICGYDWIPKTKGKLPRICARCKRDSWWDKRAVRKYVKSKD